VQVEGMIDLRKPSKSRNLKSSQVADSKSRLPKQYYKASVLASTESSVTRVHVVQEASVRVGGREISGGPQTKSTYV